MIEQDFTIQRYMQEVQPIVDEVQNSKAIHQRFVHTLQKLQEEATKCDDNLSIYLAWQEMIGRELHQQYSDKDLLELHGYPQGSIIKTDTYHTIVNENSHVVDFHFCQHRFYTPINTSKKLNQCLKC